jgi:hypothetical protein
VKLESYRRKDQGFYADLQAFLDEIGQANEVEVPAVYDIFSSETAQLERVTTAMTRKLTFKDQFNYQDVEARVFHDTPLLVGAKLIRGQPRNVQWLSSEYFNPRMWDWRPKGEQVFEVWVKWDTDPGAPVTVTFSVWGD